MRKFISLVVALLALTTCLAELNSAFNGDVQRFHEEYSMSQRLASRPNAIGRHTFVSPHVENGVEMIDAFIDFNDKAALDKARSMGVIINCVFDDFVTARIPVDRLDQVCHIPGIVNVEISRIMELCTDSTLSVTHAGQVLNGTQYGLKQAYDGTGVIIGMIDAGYDYKHLAFRRTDDHSRTRIVRVYDPMNSTGHPVVIDGNTLQGSVFMDEQIDTMTCDTHGAHGTHTTSIAAGMHVNGYGGMAPGADIVLCSSRNMDMYISETDVVEHMKYIYAYADSVNKPCVINLSVSNANGAHDAKDRISRAAAQLTGPGRIMVVSAGNNGSSALYSSGPATMEKPFSALLGSNNWSIDADNSYYYSNTSNDIWVRAAGVRPVFRFHIFDKDTKRIVWESENITLYKRIYYREFKDYFVPDFSVDTTGYLYALISQGITGKFNVTCNVHNLRCKSSTYSMSKYTRSRYQVGFSIYPPRMAYPRQPDSCYIDMWTVIGLGVTPPSNNVIYYDEITDAGDTLIQSINNFYATPSSRSSMGNYALHDSVISVGAFTGRNSYYSLNYNSIQSDLAYTIGAIIDFSSYQAKEYGPTGVELPTICAPGLKVVAAASRYSYFTNPMQRDLVMRTNDGHLWGVMSGTSMAAPTVAGIIAQWLQINPNLSPGNIKDIIAQTAIKDQFTQNIQFGPNGKIDAMAGVRYLLAHMPDDVLYGDINNDGRVDIDDITLLIRHILGNEITDEVNVVAMDMNQDDVVDIDDIAVLINKILAVN